MTHSIYLDSSTISKRYIIEKGTNTVDLLFDECEIENTNIYFSIWNIGEVLGVFDKYHNRNLITTEMFDDTLKKFPL
jgi:predicted nucleic acid-binding protein